VFGASKTMFFEHESLIRMRSFVARKIENFSMFTNFIRNRKKSKDFSHVEGNFHFLNAKSDFCTPQKSKL
jgi:GDP-D-mannose dehydratase